MTDTSLLSFEIDVLYTDAPGDVSCDGLATLVIDRFLIPELTGGTNN